MCGIVYIKRKDGRPAFKSVLKRYHKQKNRGAEGFGYVAIKDNKVVSYKRAATEHEIVKLIQQEDAPEILFHHRNPTSTPNIEEAAHPILVEYKEFQHQYFVAHNGVIYNDDELKKAHNEKGYAYSTELKALVVTASGKTYQEGSKWNDSESLAIEIALALEGKQEDIGTTGTAAAIIIQTKGHEVTNRFFFRNHGNPLRFQEDTVMIQLTSEGSGEVVHPVEMQLLKSVGYGAHLPRIFVPRTYNYAANTAANTDDWHKGKVWDIDLKRWVKRDSKNTTPTNWNLGGSVRKPLNSLLPIRSVIDPEMGLEFRQDQEDGAPLPILTLEEIIAEETRTQFGNMFADSTEFSEVVSSMTISQLWEEYDKCVGKETVLKKKIAGMETRIFDLDVDESIFSERDAEYDTLEKLQQYMDELTEEITARDSRDGS